MPLQILLSMTNHIQIDLVNKLQRTHLLDNVAWKSAQIQQYIATVRQARHVRVFDVFTETKASEIKSVRLRWQE